jgi:hypothetical protein
MRYVLILVHAGRCKWEMRDANGRWEMQMGDGRCKWEMGDAIGRWKMQIVDGRCKWEIGDAKWEMGDANGRWEMQMGGRMRCKWEEGCDAFIYCTNYNPDYCKNYQDFL